jgi:hypothetical protein
LSFHDNQPTKIMKKHFLTALIFFQFIFLAGRAQMKYDFSAIDQLWPIITTLQNDQEPTGETWAGLFKSPGYEALFRYEFSASFVKKYLQLAYKPSMSSKKQELLASDNRYLRHFIKFYSYKDSIAAFRRRLQSGEIVNSAVRLTGEYLTPAMLKNAPSAPLSFILFDADARGGYGPIIFDMIYALDQGTRAPYLFAHEMHHAYRELNLAYDDGQVKVRHQMLFQALNWLQAEGIADQINSSAEYLAKMATENDEWAISCQKQIEQSPGVIIELNRILNNMAGSPGNLAGLGDEMVSKIPRSGHPTGDYMVEKIVRYLGKKVMVETAGNPFAFIYLYNHAVKNDPSLPYFSNQAIAFLQGIEKQYIKQPRTDLARLACREGFDFSAIRAYWDIAKLLEDGKVPDENRWNQFFSIQGYQGLFNHGQANRDVIQKEIISAFSKVQNDQTKASPYFVKVNQERTELEQLVNRLEKGDLYGKIMSEIGQYVPQGLINEVPGPTFCFVFGLEDFRAVGDISVWDLATFKSIPDEADYWMRNHAIRYYLGQSRLYDSGDVLVKHDGLFSSITGLINFGAPHCIGYGLLASVNEQDKSKNIDNDFWKKVQNVPKTISKVDSLFRLINEKNESGILDQISGLIFREQAPMGYYMISAIHKELGDKAVGDYFGHPCNLLILYNEAAKKNSNYPGLSKATVTYLEGLEKRYLGEGGSRQ